MTNPKCWVETEAVTVPVDNPGGGLEPDDQQDDPHHNQHDNPDKAALVAQAEALGITVDGRWGPRTLQAKIAAYQQPAHQGQVG